MKSGGAKFIDQTNEFIGIQLVLADVVENTFEFWVGFFDLVKSVIDQP